MSEHLLQNQIRNALAGVANIFRANIGQAWQGEPIRTSAPRTVTLQPGDVLLRNARPFSTGLPKGFSDLFGFKRRVITPEDVGKTLAVFCALEIKTKTGRVTPEQEAFVRAVQKAGGHAGIARSVEDAQNIIN